MIEEYELIIIGAGATGLGAAWHALERNDNDFLILEARDQPGGLSASEADEHGFTWDQGVHLHFSHYEYYDQFLDRILPPEEWLTLQRSAAVWLEDRFVPYPIQLHLHHLPGHDRWNCLKGLLAASRRPRGNASDLADWIDRTFGSGLSNLFMTPYNEKIWATPLDRLNASWIGERVACPCWEQILERTCLQQDAEPWGPNARFRYPATGGSGRVWREAALRIPARHKRFSESVLEIDGDQKLIVTDRGRTYRYQHLISTMPADRLMQQVMTKQQLPSAARLEHTVTHLRGFGFSGLPPEPLRGRLWVYFSQPEISFYRMTMLSNLSPTMVPDAESMWSLVVEVAESRWKPLREQNLTQRVLSDLSRLGFVEKDSVPLSIWERTLPYGYPIPTSDRDRTLAAVLPALEQLDIHSRGRFGAWKYEVSNQDHSFMQGVETIERIANGQEELTLHHPDLINNRRNEFPYPEWSSSRSWKG